MIMQVEALLILLLIGAVAGFLAGVIVKGYGFGVVGNVVVGIVGAVLGGWLLPQLGLFPGGNVTGQIISATAGAIVLLVLISFVRRVA
jgi:uncharacterized membrane protein YeaQ/YmgE (transglycosylase-associated protein family)